MDDKNIIDTEYDDVEDVIYLSAPQMAKKVGTTENTIRTWADENYYGDLIGIEKVNGRKTYKETQVSSFAFIKDLVENKNMKKSQVRKYIEKHGFKYADYNSGLVNPKDPLGFEALAAALSVGTKKELDNFKKEILDQLKQYMILQGEAVNNILDNTILKVDEVVTEKMEENSKEISDKLDKSTEKTIQLQQENQKQLNEVALTVDKIEKSNSEMNDRIKELLEDPKALNKLIKKEKNNENKRLNRIFNKIFNK